MEYKANPRQESADHEMMLIIIGMIVFFALSFWLDKESEVLISGWKTLYLPQAKAIVWFSHTFIGQGVNLLLHHSAAQVEGLVQFMEATPPSQMTLHFCWAASGFINQYYLFIVIPLGGYVTWKIYCHTQGDSAIHYKFKDAKEFTAFVRQQTGEEAPSSTKGGEVNTPYHSVSLRAFANAHGLCRKSKPDTLDIKKVQACFIAQLGKQFTSREDLINQPYGWAALKMLQCIPEKYRTNTLETLSQQHRYDFTVLIALLEAAREYGVVPSSLFIALKQDYLSLWYGLNNLGRKVCFVEGAGLSAQYAHEGIEKQCKSKPKLRFVKAAVKGLIEAF